MNVSANFFVVELHGRADISFEIVPSEVVGPRVPVGINAEAVEGERRRRRG